MELEQPRMRLIRAVESEYLTQLMSSMMVNGGTHLNDTIIQATRIRLTYSMFDTDLLLYIELLSRGGFPMLHVGFPGQLCPNGG